MNAHVVYKVTTKVSVDRLAQQHNQAVRGSSLVSLC